MSCQCYQIGGPFIAFDPSCPAHGYEAQASDREQKEEEAKRAQQKQEREEMLAMLRAQVEQDAIKINALQNDVRHLREVVQQLCDQNGIVSSVSMRKRSPLGKRK